VFTAMKIHIGVFWVVMPHSVVVGCQRFRGPYCLHLQVVTPFNVVGYQCLRGPSCLHVYGGHVGTLHLCHVSVSFA
jgi:hypothetical protein